jgi:GNAT superfamily N-acetyltransferase
MSKFLVRPALASDLDALISLYGELADDEQAPRPSADRHHERVLLDVIGHPARHLVVGALDEEPVGTADLLIAANLTHGARPWAIVENVVVAGDLRGCGIGSALMGHVIDIARTAGCYKVQLLSGRRRTGAHAFYRSLGMEPVAEGFKLYLEE